jgi:hypothetical protein
MRDLVATTGRRSMQPQTFSVPESLYKQARRLPWYLAGAVLLVLAFPFLSRDGLSDGLGFLKGCLVAAAVVALLGVLIWWYVGRCVRSWPSLSVTVDADGIWPTTAGKATGLIRWNVIESYRNRTFLSRMELCDCNGNLLLKVEYALENFARLRELIVHKTDRSSASIPELPATFSTPLQIRVVTLVFYTCVSILLLLGGLYLRSLLVDWRSWIDLGLEFLLTPVVLFALVREYLTIPLQTTLDRNDLIIRYPFVTRHAPYAQIAAANLSTSAAAAAGKLIVEVPGWNVQTVWITFKDGRSPLILRQPGAEPVRLLRVLAHAMAQDAVQNAKSIQSGPVSRL